MRISKKAAKMKYVMVSIIMMAIISFLNFSSLNVKAAGGTNFDDATTIKKFNKKLEDTITKDQSVRYYKVQLKSCGKWTFQVESEEADIYFRIFNGTKYALLEKTLTFDSKTNKYIGTWSGYVESGTYYISVYSLLFGKSATYQYTTSFEQYKSQDKESNNDNSTAQEIILNGSHTGLISLTDRKDTYYFNVPEDTSLTITVSSKVAENINILIRKEDGSFSESGYATYDTSAKKNSSYTFSKNVAKGKYYMLIDSSGSSQTGKYTIKTECNISVTSMIASEVKKTVCVGDKFTIKPIVAPANANETVKFSSSNKSIATVSSKGVVKAKKIGKVTITLKTEKNQVIAKSTITVKNIAVKKVRLNKTSVTLKKGGTVTLKATVLPTNASNRKVVWSTSKSSVAKVNSKGKVTAVGTGSCIITAKSQSGGKKATCKIYVKAPVIATPEPVATESPSSTETPVISVTSVSVESSISLEVKSSYSLHAVCSPKNATNKNVTWSSSNTKVATVSSSGKITGVSRGSAVITVKTSNGKRAYCTVLVR